MAGRFWAATTARVHWLTHTNAGLATRICFGVLFFLAMATLDPARNGSRATRWREYGFLIGCVAVAVLYGVMNDLITSSISWEYFYYGKELMTALGPDTPPQRPAMARQAMLVGIKATWTAGFIIGVVLLIANNPSRRYPQLPYRSLLRVALAIFALCAICGALLGVAGSSGWLVAFNDDFADMVRENEFRPFRFMAVFGVHLGGYLGGALGAIAGAIFIRWRRRRLQGTGSNAL